MLQNFESALAVAPSTQPPDSDKIVLGPGYHSLEAAAKELGELGVTISDWAEPVLKKADPADFVATSYYGLLVSPKEIGFPEGTNQYNLLKALPKHGLKPAQIGDGLALLQGNPRFFRPGKFCLLAMKPVMVKGVDYTIYLVNNTGANGSGEGLQIRARRPGLRKADWPFLCLPA